MIWLSDANKLTHNTVGIEGKGASSCIRIIDYGNSDSALAYQLAQKSPKIQEVGDGSLAITAACKTTWDLQRVDRNADLANLISSHSLSIDLQIQNLETLYSSNDVFFNLVRTNFPSLFVFAHCINKMRIIPSRKFTLAEVGSFELSKDEYANLQISHNIHSLPEVVPIATRNSRIMQLAKRFATDFNLEPNEKVFRNGRMPY